MRLLWCLLAILACSLTDVRPAAGDGGVLAARRGPWVVYRYPLFGESNRPPEARRHSQESYWPSDANEAYPKFYGGFHSRYFDRIGVPAGDVGLRGYAW